MPRDRAQMAKLLVNASVDQAEATAYGQDRAPQTISEVEPAQESRSEPAPIAESAVEPEQEPDSATRAEPREAYGFVIPDGVGEELVQLGVRIPADLRAALRTCSMMQQIEMQELVRDALVRELRRRAKR